MNILHTLIGMGSAALAAAVPDPGTLVRRHKFPLKKELIVHSTSQHSTTWWSEHRAFRKAKLPRGGQIVHSTSQHSTSWWSDRAFHQSTQYLMVVRSCIPAVNTVPHGGQIVHSTSQHSTTCWSAQYHMVVRSCIPAVSTVPHAGQLEA